ncbi:MAG: class I SAM-dependent methyltransferase [Actinomycetota bacterium]|nr:class I SAM-dependent methyltransferase [Actinomycetota bacterium]
MTASGSGTGQPTPKRVKVVGRALNDAVARAPWVAPLIKWPIRRYFDRLARGWDERTSAGSVEHLAALAAGLMHVTPAPERALDIGTGTGEAALLLAREFPQARIRGVDISAEMIGIAKAKVGLDPEGRLAFKVADAATLPWDDGSFDLVAQLNMPPFFAEIARVLRPRGSVVIASSWGEDTPFYTSDRTLMRGFARHRITRHVAGGAASGTYWVGRKAT